MKREKEPPIEYAGFDNFSTIMGLLMIIVISPIIIAEYICKFIDWCFK